MILLVRGRPFPSPGPTNRTTLSQRERAGAKVRRFLALALWERVFASGRTGEGNRGAPHHLLILKKFSLAASRTFLQNISGSSDTMPLGSRNTRIPRRFKCASLAESFLA